MPGFLELVVEYYRRCLIQVFGILEEYEVGPGGPLPAPAEEEEEAETPPAADSDVEEVMSSLFPAAASGAGEEVKDKQEEEPTEPPPQQASKFDRLPLKVEEGGEQWGEVERRWAELSRPNGFVSGLLHWKAGGGDSTAHIQTHLDQNTGDFTPPNPAEREGRGVAAGEEGKQTNVIISLSASV